MSPTVLVTTCVVVTSTETTTSAKTTESAVNVTAAAVSEMTWEKTTASAATNGCLAIGSEATKTDEPTPTKPDVTTTTIKPDATATPTSNGTLLCAGTTITAAMSKPVTSGGASSTAGKTDESMTQRNHSKVEQATPVWTTERQAPRTKQCFLRPNSEPATAGGDSRSAAPNVAAAIGPSAATTAKRGTDDCGAAAEIGGRGNDEPSEKREQTKPLELVSAQTSWPTAAETPGPRPAENDDRPGGTSAGPGDVGPRFRKSVIAEPQWT